jgi:CheY-like chemotaxis protein
MEETRYCLCCGENVEFNRIERDGRLEYTCIYCGFPLSMEETPLTAGIETGEKTAPSAAPEMEAEKVGESYILIAEDSKYTRKIIQDLLIEKRFADQVLAFENGLELTTAYSRLISEGKSVEVVILDINMPVMDGLTAAKTLRSIESQKRIPHVPIAFFSAVKADENLRTQMEILAPANYLNKGSDPDPDRLAERVEKLISYFLQIRQQ